MFLYVCVCICIYNFSILFFLMFLEDKFERKRTIKYVFISLIGFKKINEKKWNYNSWGKIQTKKNIYIYIGIKKKKKKSKESRKIEIKTI